MPDSKIDPSLRKPLEAMARVFERMADAAEDDEERRQALRTAAEAQRDAGRAGPPLHPDIWPDSKDRGGAKAR